MKFMRAAALPALLLTGALAPMVLPITAVAQTPVQLAQYGIGFSTPAGYKRPAPKDIPPQAAQAIYIALGPMTKKFSANISVVAHKVPFAAMPSNFEQQITAQMQQQGMGYDDFKLISQKKNAY